MQVTVGGTVKPIANGNAIHNIQRQALERNAHVIYSQKRNWVEPLM